MLAILDVIGLLVELVGAVANIGSRRDKGHGQETISLANEMPAARS